MTVAFRDFNAPVAMWHLSVPMMKQSLAQMVKARTIDATHEIPYVAGYSVNGKTIYIDKDLPRKVGDIEIFPTLILHEEVEKSLMQELKLHYLHAHQIAEDAEENAVRLLYGPHGLQQYLDFYKVWIPKIGNRKTYTDVPRDLDLAPYEQERDKDTLKRMGMA